SHRGEGDDDPIGAGAALRSRSRPGARATDRPVARGDQARGGTLLTGGLLIDKPVGWTSHDVVAAVRRRLGQRSVGHTGTLDPFATGLLVVMVGRATRLARFI